MRVTLFRIFAAGGTILFGAALVLAPVAAFQDRMTIVSGLGIAGIALLLVAWLLRRFLRPPAQTDGQRQDT